MSSAFQNPCTKSLPGIVKEALLIRIALSALDMNSGSYQPIADTGNSEQAMLDDIEASTARLYQHSSILKGESIRHVQLVDGLGDEMVNTSDRLNSEAHHAALARLNRDSGFCFLYTIIAVETASLLVLLYMGL